jgi:hypothetical protein
VPMERGRLRALRGVNLHPINARCHVDVAEFDADREPVLRRARAAGVVAIVVPAINAAGWDALLELCAPKPVPLSSGCAARRLRGRQPRLLVHTRSGRNTS